MKKPIFYILFILCYSLSFSQSFQIGDTIFYQKKKVTTKNNADYYAVITHKKTIDNTNYNFVNGYKYVKDSVKFLLQSKYALKEFTTHQSSGPQTNFHKNGGGKSSEGLIKKGNPIGTWNYWYDNKSKKEVRLYYENKGLNKKHKPYDIIDYWNKEGKQTIKKGNGFFNFQNDSILRKGYYKNGKKIGKWLGFKNDEKYFEENYKKGKLITGISWNKEGKEFKYKKYRTNPAYKNGFESLKKHIIKYYRIPESAKKNKIDGRTVVSFNIMKDGSISNIRMLRSLSDDYDKEAIRIIKSMDKWTPGTIRGQKVKVTYSLPITYKLE